MDNCPTHHGRFGLELKDFLTQIGVEVVFTPRYSPEMNPAEFAFNKIRTLSRQKEYRDMMEINQGFAILDMVGQITQSDCRGFYQKTQYLDI